MDYLKNTSKVVTRCYDLLDAALAGGIKDFTDGKYLGDKSLPYKAAQKNQAEYLLDQIKCKEGSRILDIGCGNGRILKAAQARGAKAVGLTVSKEQVDRNNKQGLNAQLMNYRNIPEDWNGSFDGIIANGSLEHFVQVGDAIDGKQDDLYKELYKICHRILKPGGRFATTAIHFNKSVDPNKIIKGSDSHKRGSDDFHFAKVLLEDFGGWYPKEFQLKECAKDFFELENREDGTDDYHWTSEHWLSEMKAKVIKTPKVWLAVIKKIAAHPIATIKMIDDLMFAQSWMWQFRKQENKNTPTVLFRDTWKRIDN